MAFSLLSVDLSMHLQHFSWVSKHCMMLFMMLMPLFCFSTDMSHVVRLLSLSYIDAGNYVIVDFMLYSMSFVAAILI